MMRRPGVELNPDPFRFYRGKVGLEAPVVVCARAGFRIGRRVDMSDTSSNTVAPATAY
jgi:hypothetical protein